VGVILLGPALGFLIGVISGLSVLLLIRVAVATKATLKTTLAQISQLLAIPTFCFGGPWVTAQLLRHVDLDAMLPPYAISLAVSFTLVAGYPLAMLVIATGGRVARTGPRR
jgi:hypothetical protein